MKKSRTKLMKFLGESNFCWNASTNMVLYYVHSTVTFFILIDIGELPFKALIWRWLESSCIFQKHWSLNTFREYSTFTFLNCCLFWGSGIWVVSTYNTEFRNINFIFQNDCYAFSELPVVLLWYWSWNIAD